MEDAINVAVEPEPHLRDLFVTGAYETIEASGKEVTLWVAKPSPTQQEQAGKKARIKRARRRSELLDPNNEERKATVQEVSEMDMENVLDQLLETEKNRLQRQATNEVMFHPEVGSDWGEDAGKYLDVLTAKMDRQQELLEEAEAQETGVDFAADEEYQRLHGLETRFQEEVQERYNELRDEAQDKLISEANDPEDLRLRLVQAHIDAESELAWYSEYRLSMLYYSLRFKDKHDKLYFDSPDEVSNLPSQVQAQLNSAYDKMELGVEKAKNLDTPPPS